MRLLVLVGDFYPNISGGSLVRYYFCKEAVEKGHDVTVVTPRKDGTSRREVVKGIEVRRPFKSYPDRLPPYSSLSIVFRILYSILLFGYLSYWLSTTRIDGIHCASFTSHWVAKTHSLLFSLPLVSFVGYCPSVESDWKLTPRFVLERINFRLFMGHTVYCRGPRVRSVLESLTSARVEIVHGILETEKIRSVHRDDDVKRVKPELKLEATEKLLVTVGRLSPLKNVSDCVRVLAKLPDEFHLVIVGDGPRYDAVRRTITDHQVDDRVSMVGRLPHEEALRFIAASDGVLLTSRAESYSAVALEAISLGRPLFSTPVGVLTEISHPKVNLGSIEELPATISGSNLHCPACLDEAALERFSVERYSETILAEFDRLCTLHT